MAKDERRRQKVLARKKAKKKARCRSQQSTSGKFQTLLGGLSKNAIRHAPIHECLCQGTFQEQGIGQIIITRKSAEGDLIVGVFLVDSWCLGVKDAFLRVLGEFEYHGIKGRLSLEGTMRTITSAHARKFIESAVAYARQFGFEPPGNYHTAAVIFGDIDPSACAEAFVFGKDGKPFYFRGPNESMIRARQIVEQLGRCCGADGFDFTLPASDSEFEDEGDDDSDVEGDLDEIEDIEEEILNSERLPPVPDSPEPVPPAAKPRGLFGRLFGR